MLAATKQVIEQIDAPHSLVNLPRIHGVHLYGPYFAEEKAGCHAKSGCRPPTDEEAGEYFSTGIIKIATCAAELDGAGDFYRWHHATDA